MTTKIHTASYRIEDVIIIESNFKRDLSINDDDGSIKNHISLKNSSEKDPDNNNFWIITEANIEGKQGEKSVFSAKVVIVGIFEKIGEGELEMETFKRINGPAMLFPFLREHIATNCVKAGMKKILLPPINFTKQDDDESGESEGLQD
ncbi:protein-export chaperone SecB [Taibaiella lutea]|uniref:Protein-export chaperone SecB n=1 Tax=Taibaiella lutea TaxID=2608001 RepID=A0A5M6CFD7_9BACT|nr:protein-export chaperone SecB [Taibaiella lutea]KAA5532632.1 protein-export chaperone SecB [Taibaiella lutea]